MTIEEAMQRIEELERENNELKEEIRLLREKSPAGRKKHNESWMKAYCEFAEKYEGGMSVIEIVEQGEISRRTAYRYKAYYEELQRQNKD